MSGALSVRNLVVRVGGFRLGPLSFEVEPGRRFAVVGPSGSGKTTLLRSLAGLLEPSEGELRLGAEAWYGAGANVQPERRRVGFVFQDDGLWPHLTAEEHLRFCRPSLGRLGARALLENVGIGALAGRRPAELSGGERRRLALARALAAEPRLLLLDEPFASVDVEGRDELVLLVRRIAEEQRIPLVVVTHVRDEALWLGDRLLVLRGGRPVESGEADELVRRPRTAFAAALLAGAAVWPVRPSSPGLVETPFGPAPCPDGPGPLALCLLPGEAEAVEAGGAGPKGRVVRCETQGDAYLLTVDLAGRLVRLRSREPRPAGAEVGAKLPPELRILPEGGGKETR